MADPRKQHTEIIVDFGDGADGGSGVVTGALLLDRDGRGQPLDGVHIGLPHLVEKLTGVGRQGLHIAALSFGVDRVEGQRGLSGPAEPRDDDELVPRDLEIQTFEIVLAGAFDDDGTTHGQRNYSIGGVP